MQEGIVKKISFIIVSVIAVVLIVTLQFIPLSIFNDKIFDGYIKSIIAYIICIPYCVLATKKMGYKVLKLPINIYCFFISMLIAINNFPFFPFFKENTYVVIKDSSKTIVFIINCMFTAIFEELLFRGVIFNIFMEKAKTNKDIIKAILFSSIIFGLAHLFNLIPGADIGAVLLQVCYTTLIGALCSFILFKTHNIVFSIILHSVYNICGLILSTQGIGNGIVFDIETIILTTILGFFVGIFVLITLFKTTEKEVNSYCSLCLNIKKEE